MTREKADALVEKVAENIYLNHRMQFHTTAQIRECFSAADQKGSYLQDYKRLPLKDKKRWRVIARTAVLQVLVEALRNVK